MPDKKPQTADEVNAQIKTINDRKAQILAEIAATQQLSASDLPATYRTGKKTPEQVLQDSLKTHTYIGMSNVGMPSINKDYNQQALGRAKNVKGDKTVLDLAKEYQDLQKQAGKLNDYLQENQQLAQDAAKKQQEQAGAKSPTTSLPTDPMANFHPQFLDTGGIEDLARTGQLDLTPDKLAGLFPSVEYQRQLAQYQADQAAHDAGTSDVVPVAPQKSLADQVAPDIMRDPTLVNVGNTPGLPISNANPRDAQIAKIKALGLPAWQTNLMIDQLNSSADPGAGSLAAMQKELDAVQSSSDLGIIKASKMAAIRAKYQALQPGDNGRTSIRDALDKPYNMSADQIANLSVELFKAGYVNLPKQYDPLKPLSQQMHITSAFDPTFQAAYQAWVLDGFKDRTKTLAQIMQERQDSYMGQLQQYAAAAREAKMKAASALIKIDDPAGIRTNADALAQQLIGRKLTDAEHEQAVGYIHRLQSSAQQRAISLAANDQTGTVEDVDVAGRLKEMIQSNNPVEYDAAQIASSKDLFDMVVGGPAPSATGRI